ncbi:MAG: hypothetical protein ACQEUZ_09085 [Pseudomonadota bacterium]
MEVGTLIPVLALTTLLIVLIAAFIGKRRTHEKREDPTAPKSTLAADAPDTRSGR